MCIGFTEPYDNALLRALCFRLCLHFLRFFIYLFPRTLEPYSSAYRRSAYFTASLQFRLVKYLFSCNYNFMRVAVTMFFNDGNTNDFFSLAEANAMS